jgi:RNA polymerase sigma factor (sigma-70 family)
MGSGRYWNALFDLGTTTGLSDAELLARFLERRDRADRAFWAAEAAFEAIVRRHGPMVLGVCRRYLDDPNDVEDAFQATFIVLFRRAGAVRLVESLGPWLHGVSRRIAARSRAMAVRRKAREAGRHIEPATDPAAEDRRRDATEALDEELDRLPTKYRVPIILCHLEGLTYEEAARQLDCPVGTIGTRLARGRELLKCRLKRRGTILSVGIIGPPLTGEPAVAPPAVVIATIGAAVRGIGGRTATAGSVSASVVSLSEGLLRTMLMTRVKTAALALLTAGLIVTGGGLILRSAAARQGEVRAVPSPDLAPRRSEAPGAKRPAIRGTGRSLQEPRGEPDPAPSGRETKLEALLQLKGTWTRPVTATAVVNGVPKPPKTRKLTWSIDRDLITSSGRDGFAEHTYRISLDPLRSPKTLNLTLLNNGITLLGIYKIDGDTLTVCYCWDHRPTEFGELPAQIQAVFSRESRAPATLAQEYANTTGCYWSVKPSDVPNVGMMGDWFGFIGDAVQMSLRKDPQAGTMIIMAYMTKYDERHRPVAEYRPVILDDQGARHVPTRVHGRPSESSSISGVVMGMFEYHSDLPRDRVKKCGIEVVPAEELRWAEEDAAVRAYRQAREAGIELLPRPEVGKPLELSFTAADGTVLRSEALKGKVVLILCWDTERESNSDEMLRLKTLYERRHRDGLEVVGLNFDRERPNGERYVKALGLPWPQVFVPGDPGTWNLWSKVSGFPRFPGLLLIDRRGILRWDCENAAERDERINALLDEPQTGK